MIIQQYAPQLTALEGALQEPSEIALLQLEQTLNLISPIIQKALIFVYFTAPLVIFLLFCFFQSLIWKIVSEEKFEIKKIFKNFRNYFLKFCALTLPVFIILILIAVFILQKIYFFLSLNWQFFVLLLATFVLFYFIFICYALLYKNKTLKKTLKKSAALAFKKFHKLAPLFLPFFLIVLILALLFFNIFIMKLSGVIILSSLLYSLFGFLIVLAIAIWYKILINLILEKY